MPRSIDRCPSPRREDRRARSRSQSPHRRYNDHNNQDINRDRGRKKQGGFRWKEKPRRDDDSAREPERGLERGYRSRRSPPRDRNRDRDGLRDNGRERDRDADRDRRPRDKDRDLERVRDRSRDRDGKKEPQPKEKKEKKPAAPSEPMIVVHVNDRLGTKAAIPCLASDPIRLFKAQVAARIGREPHEILLKRQGERPFKDQLTLEDYGVSNGVQLDLEMVRNIVVLGGTSHPHLNKTICDQLGIPAADVLLSKFSVGETRVEIYESVRGKDVYIIQSGGGKVNDHLMELLITISACKTASAKRVTAVLPLFPYSRQSDIPYNKAGAPLVKSSLARTDSQAPYTFESTPPTPHPGKSDSLGLTNGIDGLQKGLAMAQLEDRDGSNNSSPQKARISHYVNGVPKRSDTLDSVRFEAVMKSNRTSAHMSGAGSQEDAASIVSNHSKMGSFQPRPGYRQWVAQAGTLVADLLTCAGADHIITMDLHDPQYQGFFDIPVDNLYGRPLLKKYIQENILKYKSCIIVSPDAGGAKRATAIADSLGMEFALIHKERRPTKITDRQNATMMLVGDVKDRTCILIDDLADTSNTITRAAKLLKKEGASKVYALVTHGILSGDAIDRINASALDKVVVTNTVDQDDHLKRCPKLEVLEVGHVFAEAIRRVHHGESISVLFQYD
ncbi:ribose-phosphate pyrophosphokinase [Ophidiomyces ophidiicola]|nr:ribose-phosphate pyrophosphokinase [Ophidiomyces ophidiicola]KAI1956184.1 ribose-phosphate pyrophosphokinase [Ophidiomyces ophidiicola]KAI1970298.1 ribose-phosphate pyrophosphokinase [Ophidiomyces ophidiicola]KAI2007922.1 ribose-phosphate pyrophosphokinase [Ophidiomyces ophidiicola]KAI2036986.1 ribose-phosphate pyrophosphokinase [Ophidiomyces ophidiicola]